MCDMMDDASCWLVVLARTELLVPFDADCFGWTDSSVEFLFLGLSRLCFLRLYAVNDSAFVM